MAKRSKAKSYRIVSPLTYKGTRIGPGEEVPIGLSQADIGDLIRRGKIREKDPATGANIEPKHTNEIELNPDQVKSFFAKPGPHIAKNLQRTDFSVETLARIHVAAERMNAPKHVMDMIGSALERKVRR